jgi:hypothetical protein
VDLSPINATKSPCWCLYLSNHPERELEKCNLVESGSCKHACNDKITCIWLSMKFAQEAKNWFPDNSCQNWGITIVQALSDISMLKDGEHKLLHCLQKSWWLEIVVYTTPSRIKSPLLLIEPSGGNLNSFYPYTVQFLMFMDRAEEAIKTLCLM